MFKIRQQQNAIANPMYSTEIFNVLCTQSAFALPNYITKFCNQYTEKSQGHEQVPVGPPKIFKIMHTEVGRLESKYERVQETVTKQKFSEYNST
jgi:hypothetical protein